MKRLFLTLTLTAMICGMASADMKISKIQLDLTKLDAGIQLYEFTYENGRMATSKFTIDGTVQYFYTLSWQPGKLVCTNTASTSPSTETYILDANGRATSYTASNGAHATFTYDSNGYLISGNGADGAGDDAVNWSASATYQNQSITKAVVSDGSDTYNITFTPSSTQDIIGLYQHLYDSMGFATGFFSGVMGKSSRMLPSKASTTIEGFPITLTWNYTYTEGRVTAYTETATLIGTVVKANISYVNVVGSADKINLDDQAPVSISGHRVMCAGHSIEAFTPSGLAAGSGVDYLELPSGLYILRIGTRTLKVRI